MTEPRFAETPEDLASVEEMRAVSGLDFLQGIVDGRYAAPPIARTLAFTLTEVAEGRAVFRGRPRFDSFNPIGSVHGGWYGAVLDSCMACAVQTMLPAGRGYTTLEYRVNIVRPIRLDGEEVLAVGEALHVGGRTGTGEGKIIGADSGKLYAFGTTTCLMLEL